MRRSDAIFVRLPTAWIEAGGLKAFRWGQQGGAETAALLALIALAQNADQETGQIRVTYDRLCLATGMSRAMLSAGLKILERRAIVARAPDLGQSGFRLVDFNPFAGWGKLPKRYLYDDGRMPSFAEFTLRNANQLNGLKLYLLFVARRDRNTNQAHVTYDQIEHYTGIDRPRIRAALSVLTSQGLVHTDKLPSRISEHGVANAYRLAHVDGYIHAGTRGRAVDLFSDDPYDLSDALDHTEANRGSSKEAGLPRWAR